MQPSKQNVLMSSICRLRTALSGRHYTLMKVMMFASHWRRSRHDTCTERYNSHSAACLTQPSIMPLIEERVSQKLSLKWVCMITVRIRDRHQHCGTGSSSQVERIEDDWTDADFLFRR